MAKSAGKALAEHRAILGVRSDADEATLKAAYKEMSLKHHPDHEGGSAEAFQRVATAYEVLSKHAHEERWGTSSSAYGAGVAQAQPLRLKN
eukprot:TRINITY_DN104545_c0_g1_i1.p1 TRINITY_DN104545_c0_g1~~TRINITY_DN104545_c0_g1_i1.p1  ORF type:complete len:101 (-),score=25.96 TRINITY_DN104545_c0_g1_i1:108-380(-)